MKTATLALGMVLLMVVGSTKRAEACDGEGALCGVNGGVVAAAVIVAGGYAGVTLGMGIKDLASDDHSVGYGIAETVIHMPLAGLWGLGLASELESGRGFSPALAAMTVLHGTLAVHGIYTITKVRPTKERATTAGGARRYQGSQGMFSVGRVSATVAPAPMQNGAGVGLSGTF